MMKLFHYHMPELIPPQAAADCAVAIDVLRATTTIAAALAAGAEAVQVFDDIETLRQVSERWPADQRVTAGERGGRQVAGCDLGNSPLACTPERLRSRRLFFSTTNGTRCLQRIQATPLVLTAALVNRQRVAQYLLARQPAVVWLVGSGWEGGFSLEDTVCAGAVARSVLDQSGASLGELAGNDELIAALALYWQWRDRLAELLELASHGQRLLRLGCHDDIRFCAQTDVLDVLPVQTATGVLETGSA